MNTTASVLAKLAGSASNNAAQTVLGGNGIVGLGLALFCFFLSMLATWIILRLTLVVNGARPRSPPSSAQTPNVIKSHGPTQVLLGEGFLMVRLEDVGTSFWTALAGYLTGSFAAVSTALEWLLANFFFFIGLLIVAAVSGVFLVYHDTILEVSFEVIQCGIRPTLDQVLLPLVNVLRFLFAFVWPFVNALRDILSALTFGNLFIVLKCTTKETVQAVVTQLLSGAQLLAQSFASFVTFGLLTNGRWNMIPGLTALGNAINATRAIGDCYCLDAQPLWDFLYALPTDPTLFLTIDCGVNWIIRSWQLPLNVVLNFQAPNTTNWATEGTCFVFGVGDYAKDTFKLFIEFIIGILDFVDTLVTSLTVHERSILFTRVAALHAASNVILNIPASLREMQATPGAVPMRGLGLAWLSAANDAIRSAHGESYSIFQFDAISPLEDASAMSLEEVTARKKLSSANLVDQTLRGASLIDPITNASLLATLGLDALLRVANTPWATIITGPIAIAIGAVNLTVNAICHPTEAFGKVTGIAYFQYGVMGDYTRMTVNAAVELLAFFNVALPCTFSKPVQAIASLPQTFFEFLTGAAFGWAFPPWAMGVPPPINCSIVNCSQPAPTNWSALDAFAQYYAWNGSRLRENLNLLLEGGECTAFLLGCNTTADNNNSTNLTSTCTDAPVACAARGANKVLVTTLNVTLALLFYMPDIWRFSPNYHTFADLPILDAQLAWEEFITCLGLLIDLFDTDGEHCLTSTPPEPTPGHPNFTSLPPDVSVGVYNPPPRTEWECRLDGGAYYWDGRQVVVLDSNNFFNLSSSQYPCAINESRLCAVAISDSLEVLGSAPDENVTLVVSPQWVDDAGADALVLMYNATTGTSLLPLPNATELAQRFNVSNVTQSDCTHSLPLPPMLGPEYACQSAPQFSTAVTAYTTPYYQLLTVYQSGVGYLVSSGTEFPCNYTLDTSIYCDSSNLWIHTPAGNRQIFYQVNDPGTFYNVPISCTGTTAPQLNNMTCRYNSLVKLKGLPIEIPNNDTLFYPVYYYPDASLSTATQFVACENMLPPNYSCEFGSMQTNHEAIFAYNSSHAVFTTFSCATNPLLVAPTCTRINISYTTGPNVVIELEGGEVRVYANGTKEPLPCLYQEVPLPAEEESSSSVVGLSSAGLAAMTAADEDLPASEDGVNFRKKIDYARRVAFMRRLRRDGQPSTLVASRGQLDAVLLHSSILLPLMSQTMQGAAAIPRYVRLMSMAANVSIASVYRKQSFVCFTSVAVTASLQFVISFAFAVFYLLQGLFTLPAIPSYPVNIPTFAVARDNLRTAACNWASAITEMLPFSFHCPGVGGPTLVGDVNGTACDDFAQCGRNFLCELINLPILVADFIVDTLTLLKALINGTPTPTGDHSILGPTCSQNNPGDCVVSFLIYVTLNPILTTTMVFRTAAAILDCIFCALTRVVVSNVPCVSGFYIVVGTLADIVDGILKFILPILLNLLVGIVEFWIYLFAGQFAQMWNAFTSKILGSFYLLVKNLGQLLIGFITRLPIVGAIANVLVNLVQGSCSVLNTVITQFGGTSLQCNSVTSGKKRGLEETGWLANVWSNVTYVWSHEAAAACGSRMTVLNATDNAIVSGDADLTREVMYCFAAHLWIGPTATPEANVSAQTLPEDCDMIMPNMYLNGYTWSSLDVVTQSRALACVQPRLNAEFVRADANYSGTWIPHNIFYASRNSISTMLGLFDDTVQAYGIYNQYSNDRSIPAGQLISSEYRTSWSMYGYSVAHLNQLASNPNITSAQVYQQLDAAQGAFSIEAYVQRAVNGTGPPLGLFGRRYNAERLTGIIRSLVQPILNGTGGPVNNETGESMSFASYVMASTFDQIEQRSQVMTTSIPLTGSIIPRLFAANDSRLLLHTMSGAVDAVMIDIPAALVTLARAPGRIYSSMKRSLPTNAPPLTLYFYNALVGGFTLAREFLTGKAAQTFKWIQHNATKEWLASQANLGSFKNPIGGVLEPKQSLVGASASYLMSGIGAFLRPLAQTSNNWGRLLDMSLSDSNAMSSASLRRVRLSRLTARFTLLAAVGGDMAVFQRTMAEASTPRWARASQVNNVTDVTCLFAVSNGSSLNLTGGNITYPLCDDCLGLDQIFGRFQRSIFNVLYFFGYTNASCTSCATDSYPSLNYSVTNFQNDYNYLTDPAAVVVIGYSPVTPVPAGFPSQNHSWWSWWNDPTPNKTGFNDLAALINATLDYIHGALDPLGIPASVTVTVSGGPPTVRTSTASVAPKDIFHRVAEKLNQQNHSVMSNLGPIHQPIYDLLSAFWPHSVTLANASLATLNAASASSTVPVGPFTSLKQVLEAWFNYILSFFLCPFAELSFNGKRFSLGYVAIYGIFVFLLLTAIGQAISPGNVLVVVFGSAAVATTLLFLTWIVVAYQFGFLCYPALPLGFGDDFMYFIIYSLLSKCGIGYGVVNEPYYDNTNCYPCANWQAGWFTVPNFWLPLSWGGRFGFQDIRYNIAFILRAAFPTIYNALRPGGWLYHFPGASLLLSGSFFQSPLSAYAFFDPVQVSATQYRQYWQGGTWVTGIPNLFLALAALYLVFQLLWPFISQTLSFLFAIYLVILPLVLFFFTGIYMIACFDMDDPMNPSAAPPPSPPPTRRKEDDEDEEEEQQGGGGEEEDDTKAIELEAGLVYFH